MQLLHSGPIIRTSASLVAGHRNKSATRTDSAELATKRNAQESTYSNTLRTKEQKWLLLPVSGGRAPTSNIERDAIFVLSPMWTLAIDRNAQNRSFTSCSALCAQDKSRPFEPRQYGLMTWNDHETLYFWLLLLASPPRRRLEQPNGCRSRWNNENFKPIKRFHWNV